MSNTLEYAEYLNAVKAKTSELNSLLNKEFGFKLNEVVQSYTSLFNRFCPYKVGDRVQLKADIEVPKGHGWKSSQHFLIKGAIATVKACEYRNDLFCFGLEFDNESWIDMHEEIKLVSLKHLFYFSERHIEKADANQGS